jgi:cell division protein FtsZ
MSITISVPEKPVLKPKIVVFGVGGGGCNAVNNMISAGLEGVDFVVSNTDAQSLEQNKAERCIQMGTKRTQGLGAGSAPEIGFEAAEEVIGDISDAIHGAHLVFVTAGMGGGTGTGAAPVVARLAKEMGALTVGVVTKPFLFEGNRRMRVAEAGIREMEQYIDTLLVIPNQNLFRVAGQDTSFSDAFLMADKVLLGAVGGITNLMVRPGVINLDFADVRTVMAEMGKAMIGTGEASGDDRAIQAAEQALNNPLLDDISMKGARGVLISVSASDSLKLYEVEEAMQRIRSEVDEDAQIIPGTAIDESLGDVMKVSVVATGIGQQETLELPEPEEDSDSPNLTVVQKDKIAGEEVPVAATAMTAQHEEKPVFQVVSPVKNAPIAPEVATQQVATQQAAAPAFAPPPAAQQVAPQQVAPMAAEPTTEKETEYAAGGVNPFGLPPEPAGAAPMGSAPASLAPKAEAKKPKGFVARIKAKLKRIADEDSQRQHVPARSLAESAAPESAAPKATPESAAALSSMMNQEPSAGEGDDQMEIPNFLKSQAN